ncbi:alpha/beta hydrolase [Magnetospira thiophila]
MIGGNGPGVFLALAALAYGLFVGLLYVFQRGLMYHPGPQYTVPEAVPGHPMRTVVLTTEDGLSLQSWYAPAAPGQATLVYFHGNAGSLDGRLDKVMPFLQAGYGMLLVAYRGYNGNPGTPDEAGLYADGRAALDFLKGQGSAPGDWVLYGESLGTGIASKMAAELAAAGTAVRAVILEAPFTSMAAAAQDHYFYLPARWLVRDRYDSLSRIAQINSPLLILHGHLDQTISIKLGRQLLAAAAAPKRMEEFPQAGHNDLFDHGAASVVLDFLKVYSRVN